MCIFLTVQSHTSAASGDTAQAGAGNRGHQPVTQLVKQGALVVINIMVPVTDVRDVCCERSRRARR
jgi:hypothetical protein